MDRPRPDLKRGGVLFVGGFPDAGSARRRRGKGGEDLPPLPFSGYRTMILRSIVEKVKAQYRLGHNANAQFTYVCQCNPEFDSATKRYAISVRDFDRCSVILKDFIDIQQPDAIVALGADAYRALGLRGNVAERRGRPASYRDKNGREMPVICTFDVGTVFKRQGIIELFRDDIEKAFKVGSGVEAEPIRDFLPLTADEIVSELEKMDANVSAAPHGDFSRRLVAFDLETSSVHPELPDGRITVMSFSNVDRYGVAFPYDSVFVKHPPEDRARIDAAVEKLLTNPNIIIATANGGFDMKWMWSRGLKCNDHKWDVIVAEHVLSEDKKGLYSLKDLTRFRFPEYGNYEVESSEIKKAKWEEKRAKVRELKEEAKAHAGDNLLSWWLALSDSEREERLGAWVKAGLLELKDTAGLSSVKTAKRNGVAGPTKKYLASALRALKKVPEAELPESAKVSVVIPPELLEEGFEDAGRDNLLHYAAMDTIVTRLIALRQYREMGKDIDAMRDMRLATKCVIPPLHESFLGLSMPLSVELAHMELHGIRLDRDKAKEFKGVLEEQTAFMLDRMFTKTGYRFNPGSPADLAKVLYEDLKLPIREYTDTGAPSTRKAVIKDLYAERHDISLLEDLLSWRELSKASGSFIDNWLEESSRDGYIHAEFKQTGTATYRLSSKNPNLQNVPFGLSLPNGGFMNLKSLFLPDDGFDLYDLDIKNAEMRVLCAYSKDERLIAAFNEGKDLHSLTATGISGMSYEQIMAHKDDKTRPEYIQRQVAKKVNFGTIYCMGPGKLKTQLWTDCRLEVDERQAQDYLDGFFRTYPDVKRYIDNTKEFVDRHHFVHTYFGRRRRFPYADYMLNDREHMHRQAVNARIQSTSSDMVMACLIRLNRYLRGLGDGSQVLLTVHDSLPFQAPHGAHEHIKEVLDRIIVDETAELCPWLPVRWEYDCGWGDSYGETHGEIH